MFSCEAGHIVYNRQLLLDVLSEKGFDVSRWPFRRLCLVRQMFGKLGEDWTPQVET